MKYSKISWHDLPLSVSLSLFEAGDVAETHVVLTYNNNLSESNKQFEDIGQAIVRLKADKLKGAHQVWARYFLSDAHNQAELIGGNEPSFSLVQQPSLNGAKLTVWLYFVSKGSVDVDGNRTSLTRPNYTHHFHTQLYADEVGVESQTYSTLDRYCSDLRKLDCSLEGNCIRTWIYIQGVDVNYKGMFVTRKKYFDKCGLSEDTHYIASTGIEGCHANPAVLFLMDAYAVKGIKNKQVKYLHAATHLSPTNIYGVTFERGTSVDYGDRRHIFISGTASIDNKGEIVHEKDILLQLNRTIENITVLLAEAEAKMTDIAQMIVYLRDMADYYRVLAYIDENYAEIPAAIVLAPVCRPGWLIEIECIAIKKIKADFYDF